MFRTQLLDAVVFIVVVNMVGRRRCGGLWAAALLAALAAAGPVPSPPHHHLTKRSFHDIECKGVYDASMFASVDRICDDCFNLYREPTLHAQCRQKCFTTRYFKACLEAQLRLDEEEEYDRMIEYMGRK